MSRYSIHLYHTNSNFSAEFTEQCLSGPESADETVPTAIVIQDTNTSTLHATATPLLREWAKAKLTHDSWKDALHSTVNVSLFLVSILVSRVRDTLVFKFIVSRFTIYHVMCEHLETVGRTSDASECSRQMVVELVQQEKVPDEQADWILGEWSWITCRCYQSDRCSGKLENLGDTAMGIEQYDDAIFHYSEALLLHPVTPLPFLLKRSKAYMSKGMWEQALNDANKVRPFVSRRLAVTNRPLIGHRAQPTVSMGLRAKACRVTQSRTP